MLYSEIIAVCSEIRTININALCGDNVEILNVKPECLFKADSHIACRAHAVPLPCREAKGLECVFPIWFTHCDRVW
jgi:hypothetical protein